MRAPLIESRLMQIEDIERQALGLPVEERARLPHELLESLDTLSPEEQKKLWLQEAARRAEQIDRGEAELIPAEVAAKKARSLLK